ncbi:MAG: TonB-dependent receptor [Bryobacteraceae bacterium]|nr:TonB-dependent receptor [Bryobacteraceae bacterium]
MRGLLLSVALYSGALQAQSIFGEIRGIVTDATGSVVSKASVKATRTSTGDIRRTETDESGNYALSNLDAGMYDVLIEKQGFRAAVSKEVALRAREVTRINVTLEVASAATEVQVVDTATVVQTDMATIMDSKSANELNRLPVNYRAGSSNTFYNIISTAPNVQPDRSGNFSVGGGMPFMATASVDGVSNINVRSNGILSEMFPSADSVDEVRVSSTNNNAEFAQSGDITVTSRSGTNQFHGTAYWYHQNGAFDARNFFQARTPFKVSNDYGATFGGPAIKNRTFFFGSFEGLKFRAQSVINIIVPPASFRSGNLSSVATPLRDPLNNNAPFTGNIIPASRITAQSRGLLDALYPNATRAGDNIASPNYSLTPGSANNNDQYDLRVDHNFSSAHRIFGRYSQKEIDRVSPNSLYETLGDTTNTLNPKNVVGAWNWVARANLLNEFRFGYANQRTLRTFGVGGQPFDGVSLMSRIGMQGLPPDPPKGAQAPNIGINGFAGTGIGREGGILSNTYQFADNLTWIKGAHTFKFGADIRRLRTTDITSFFSGDDLGVYSFNGQYSGFGFADFLLGIPNQTQFANTGADVDGVTYHYGFYAQDDWKATKKLTLSVGLRYELHPMFYDNALTTTNFDRAFPGPGARVVIANEEARKFTAEAFKASIGNTPIALAKDVGLPETLRYNDYDNFAPRFGFAYRPFDNNKTVIRGGYGIYTATVLGSVFYTITGIHVSDARTFPNQLVNGVPALRFPAPFGTGLGALGVPDFRRGTQWDGEDPYTQQWSFTIERELPAQIGLRATYSGSRTIKLFSSPDLNQVAPNTQGFATARLSRPYPVWNIVYVRDPNRQAFYQGVTFEATKRYRNGLFFQTSYVWSKNLSNATGSAGSGFASENGDVPTDRFSNRLDYGNVPGTRRHRWLTTFAYDLPFAKDANRFLKLAIGGWQLSGIYLWQSGQFVTPNTGNATDPSGTNLAQRGTNRPDYTGTSYGNLESDRRAVAAWFDRSAFSIPASNIGRFGYVGPGMLIGPPTRTFSAKLQKRFSFTERIYAQLEGSAANLTNTANFDIPALNVNAADFGRITSTLGVENAGSRNLQVGLRIGF